jgi:exopolyphosphatase/guanosine-5'-triphosphate,3'-diphosphate pyrophosphatase
MFTRKQYWNIAKMVAILRVANALDRSHKQRLKDVKLSITDHELIIGVNEESSIALERGLFKEKADFFENIFSIRPVIREVK